LPERAGGLQDADAVIVCPECSAENLAAADRCCACGADLDNAAVQALLGQYVLGGYKIVDVVGKGGMSVVYKARHRMTDQVVALKILPAELAVHPEIKARFLEEAKALAKLEHPNIVRLYNFGEEHGRFVLAMQFVEGTTFERKIFAAGRLEWRAAVAVARQVLEALGYAHGRGIVHRDIKPSNILVRADESAMVMDFGIAKMAEGSARLTATGQTMGTVRYMSPEQVRGHVVDHRSDLYSVGATLFEGIVGDTPYDGTTHFEIMMKHLNEAVPSLAGRDLATPPALDRVLARSLAKDSALRFQSAAEFLAALDEVLAEVGPGPSGSRPPVAAAPSGSRPPVAPAPSGSRPPVAPAPSGSRPPVAPGPRHEPAAPASASATGAVTGLARALEPEERPASSPRRAPLWLALGGLVALAAVGAAVMLGRAPAPSVSGPADAEAPALDWPEPALLPGFVAAADERHDPPAQVRVLAAHAVDDAALTAAYLAARDRFVAWAAARYGRGLAVEVRPLNLVVADATTVCAAVTRFARTAAPADCASAPPRFYYQAKGQTLYVRALDQAGAVSAADLARNLAEGAAQHLCVHTAALIELGCMKGVLPPYWDEVERP
jgi:serine/threonine-protein kinase